MYCGPCIYSHNHSSTCIVTSPCAEPLAKLVILEQSVSYSEAKSMK